MLEMVSNDFRLRVNLGLRMGRHFVDATYEIIVSEGFGHSIGHSMVTFSPLHVDSIFSALLSTEVML